MTDYPPGAAMEDIDLPDAPDESGDEAGRVDNQLPGAALQGTTTNKLPYPESSEPLNQGANAIKALALALDPRTPYVVEARKVGVTINAGQGSINFAKAFAAAPVIIMGADAVTAGAPNYYVPTIGILTVTATTVTFFVAAVQTGGSGPVTPWGGAAGISYIAMGPV